MPTYEYLCESGHRYEKREGFDAPAKQKCPTCKRQASRVLFAPPVVFKGSGFYKTDNRGSSSSGGASSSDDTPAPAPAAADDGHGHSHGPGSHSHPHGDDSSSSTATESAAAS